MTTVVPKTARGASGSCANSAREKMIGIAIRRIISQCSCLCYTVRNLFCWRHMGHRSWKITLPLLAMAAGFAVEARGSNLVADGGFESAALAFYGVGPIGDGWTVTTGGIDVENFSDFDAPAHSGSPFIYLDEA